MKRRNQPQYYSKIQPWYFAPSSYEMITRTRDECYKVVEGLSGCPNGLDPIAADFVQDWRTTTVRLYSWLQSFAEGSRDQRMSVVQAALPMISNVIIGEPLEIKVRGVEGLFGDGVLYSPGPVAEYVLREAALLVLMVGEERENYLSRDHYDHVIFESERLSVLWEKMFRRRLEALTPENRVMWISELRSLNPQIGPHFQVSPVFLDRLDKEFPEGQIA